MSAIRAQAASPEPIDGARRVAYSTPPLAASALASAGATEHLDAILGRLVALIAKRLDLAHNLAWHEFARGLPIEREREDALLDGTLRRRKRPGSMQNWHANFSTTKSLPAECSSQNRYASYWQLFEAPKGSPPSLDSVTCPKLNALTAELVGALSAVQSLRDGAQCPDLVLQLAHEANKRVEDGGLQPRHWKAILVAVGHVCSESAFPPQTGQLRPTSATVLSLVANLIGRRLDLAHDVAWHKKAHGQRMEDGQREEVLLAGVSVQAQAMGIADSDFVRAFFKDQMDASKLVQVSGVTRKRLDALDKALLRSLLLAQSIRTDERCRGRALLAIAVPKARAEHPNEPNRAQALDLAVRSLCALGEH